MKKWLAISLNCVVLYMHSQKKPWRKTATLPHSIISTEAMVFFCLGSFIWWLFYHFPLSESDGWNRVEDFCRSMMSRREMNLLVLPPRQWRCVCMSHFCGRRPRVCLLTSTGPLICPLNHHLMTTFCCTRGYNIHTQTKVFKFQQQSSWRAHDHCWHKCLAADYI